jgi:hypothetical protein
MRCFRSLEGCIKLHAIWKEQKTQSAQKRTGIDEHRQNWISHLDRMTNEMIQKRLYIIKQKSNTDAGVRVLSHFLQCEVHVVVYVNLTRAVFISETSLFFHPACMNVISP